MVNINKSQRIVFRPLKVNLGSLLASSIIPRRISLQRITYRMETKVGKMAKMYQKEQNFLRPTRRMIAYQILASIPGSSTLMFK